MNPFGILTLVAVGLILGVTALYLIRYLVALRRVDSVLGTVSGVVNGIAGQVKPLTPVLANVNGNLAKAHGALAGVLGR